MPRIAHIYADAIHSLLPNLKHYIRYGEEIRYEFKLASALKTHDRI